MAYRPYKSTWSTTGTISALNGRVELDAEGSSSAVISVSGDFVGTLTVTGSESTVAENGIQGSRLLFKSGVGSLGSNSVNLTATTGNTEYRIVTGGKSIRVNASLYTSGTATVKIVASAQPSTVFVNGPVHDSLEQATRAGRAFSVGTGITEVTAGNFLNYIFSNPSGSGVNAFVTLRSFTNNRANGSVPLEVGQVISPVALDTPVNVIPANLRNGSGTSSMLFNYKAQAARIDSSPTTANPIGLITPTGGIVLKVETMRLVQPGESFGFFAGGAGNNLASAARIAMNVVWYEESVN